jgi:hypothetical protein
MFEADCLVENDFSASDFVAREILVDVLLFFWHPLNFEECNIVENSGRGERDWAE